MLFLLTSGVQTGKTRWLQGLLGELAERNVPTFGVIAPGRWVPKADPAPDEDPFDKVGIDNVLLPEGTVVPFAVRADRAKRDGTFDAGSQSAQAELAWHISDDALATVNRHFDRMLRVEGGEGNEKPSPATPGLLVVDELGRLEVLYEGGLTSALRLLDRGPSKRFPHALVVVRDYLADQAEERFAPAWGTATRIAPDAPGRQTLLRALDPASPSCQRREAVGAIR